MWPNRQFPADLVTFTEEIVNGKLHFLCSELLIFILSKNEFVNPLMSGGNKRLYTLKQTCS